MKHERLDEHRKTVEKLLRDHETMHKALEELAHGGALTDRPQGTIRRIAREALEAVDGKPELQPKLTSAEERLAQRVADLLAEQLHVAYIPPSKPRSKPKPKRKWRRNG